MRQTLIIILLCVTFPYAVKGQCTSSQEKPSWVNGFFQEQSNSYIEAVSSTGYTEEEARNKAANIAIERRSLATGKRVNTQTIGDNIIISGADNFTVKSRIVDEYREYCDNGQYRVYLLVQTAKNPTFSFEQVNVTDTYPFSPRVFVPGMAQLYRGNRGKAYMFIGGEVVLVGGIIVFEGLRSSYNSKINLTHNAADRQLYINRVDNMQNLRNGFIAGAAALYIWNVVDGIVGKGKKRVVVGNVNAQLSPYATSEAGGISLAINF